jgi:hypothetical protein
MVYVRITQTMRGFENRSQLILTVTYFIINMLMILSSYIALSSSDLHLVFPYLSRAYSHSRHGSAQMASG